MEPLPLYNLLHGLYVVALVVISVELFLIWRK